MKDALFPSVRAPSALRMEAETLLAEGESISAFLLAAVEHEVERRRHVASFLERGLQRSRHPSGHIDAAEVVDRLRERLATRLKGAE